MPAEVFLVTITSHTGLHSASILPPPHILTIMSEVTPSPGLGIFARVGAMSAGPKLLIYRAPADP